MWISALGNAWRVCQLLPLVCLFHWVATDQRSLAQPVSQSTTLEWPRFLGSRMNGHAATAAANSVVLPVDWKATPTLVWSLDVGEGYGIGSVADGKYIHFDSIISEDRIRVERVRSIEMRTGKVVWEQSSPLRYRDLYGYETGPRASATIEDPRAVEGNRAANRQLYTMGVGGELTCRSMQDGSVRWSVNTAEKYHVVQNFFGAGSAPLVWEDLVIVMVGGSPEEDQQIPPGQLNRVSPNGSGLVAFDRNTGTERWRCVDDLASYSSVTKVELDRQPFLLLFARDHLWCVNPTDGSVAWKYGHRANMLESVNAMTPVVQDNQIFISECYGVGSALLEATPTNVREVWKDPPLDRRRMSMRCHWATPVLIDGLLYGCSGRNAPDSDFRCVEWATGRVAWTALPRRRSSVTRDGSRLVILEERGKLHIAPIDDQELKIETTTDLSDIGVEDGEGNSVTIAYPCWSAPVVLDDTMLIRGDRQVLCLRWPRHSIQ